VRKFEEKMADWGEKIMFLRTIRNIKIVEDKREKIENKIYFILFGKWGIL
jgi:hypothetical protein